MQLQLYAFVSKEASKVMACEIAPLQHFGSMRDEATILCLGLHTQNLQQEEEVVRFRQVGFG